MNRMTSGIGALALATVLLAACGNDATSSNPAPVAADQAVSAAAPNGGTPGQNGGRAFTNRQRASELPAEQPVAFGTFVRRDGNTLEIHPGFFGRRGQGNGQGNNQANAAGPAPTPAPPIDITVDSSTKIFRDTTKVDPAAFQSGQTIQQTVEKVDSLDALKLDSNSILQAWGDLSGGKMTARVLVYAERQPRPQAQTRAQQTQP